MTDKAPAASNADIIEAGAQWFTNALLEGTQQTVASTLQVGRQHYGDAMMLLILHESGRRLGQAQQAIVRASQNWYGAVGMVGQSAQTLPGTAAQIHARMNEQPPSNPA